MAIPWEPGRLSRSVEAPFPRSPRPQLATLVKEVPEGDDWLHEIKHDGYRLLCSLREGRVRLLTRGGLDWADKLSRLASSAKELPARDALLDGEIVILRPDGTSDFQALQKTIGGASPAGLTYYLFDVIYGDGYSLANAPLFERKELLRSLLEGFPPNDPKAAEYDELIYEADVWIDEDGEVQVQRRAAAAEVAPRRTTTAAPRAANSTP